MATIKNAAVTKAALIIAVAAVLLTGCATTTTTNSSLLLATATPTPAPTETPVVETPVDPVVEATEASGLSAEMYAEVTARTQTTLTELNDADSDTVLAALEAVAADYGKPLAVVWHYRCPNSGTPAWGISGALFGAAPPGCGTGYAESREATLEKVEQRATQEKSWTPDDYILVFTDTVG